VKDPLPSEGVVKGPCGSGEERGSPTPMAQPWAVLPNNLADWPSRKIWQSSDSSVPRIFRRATARLAALLLLGGLLGFGAYSAIGQADTALPLAVTAPAQEDVAAATTPDDVVSTSDDGGASNLDLTGLAGNHSESQNWAGYAATEGGYTGVSATWTTSDALPSPVGFDAAWVGIGGVTSRDLIQAGTQRSLQRNGATRHEAWIEVLPRASEIIPMTIGSGDTIRVSISQQGPELWVIVFTNITSGQTYQVSKRYASSLSSVEWIEEVPSSGRGRILPLANFGAMHFSQAAAMRGEQLLTIAESAAHPITMTAPGGLALAEPSRLGPDGASFTVTRTTTPSPSRRR
jgi:Peptidase A4 family